MSAMSPSTSGSGLHRQSRPLQPAAFADPTSPQQPASQESLHSGSGLYSEFPSNEGAEALGQRFPLRDLFTLVTPIPMRAPVSTSTVVHKRFRCLPGSLIATAGGW